MDGMVPVASRVDLKNTVLSKKVKERTKHNKVLCVNEKYNKRYKVTLTQEDHRLQEETGKGRKLWELLEIKK